MKLRGRVGILKQRAATWDSQPEPSSEEEAWSRVDSFYADLRLAWERAVEERLFRGVVQRFQRAVKTLSLKHVEVTAELVAMVDEGMTRASAFVHDQPTRGGIQLPNREQITADLQLLVDFEDLVKAK